MSKTDFQNGFALGMASGGVVEVVSEELLATKQDTLVSGENIKTINGESILGEGDLFTDKKWKLITDMTIPEENACVTLFVDKDDEGKPFSCSEIDIIWQGIKVTDDTQSGYAWISLNPTVAGYNKGVMGWQSTNFFYYTAQNNYTRGVGIKLGKGVLWCTDGHDTTGKALNIPNSKITSLEISGYQKKSFYGRVVIYGR